MSGDDAWRRLLGRLDGPQGTIEEVTMFEGLRAKALFFSLRRTMHPGHAYLVSVACYRPRKLERGDLRPVVSAQEARRLTSAWRGDTGRRSGSAEELLASLYGVGQKGQIRAFIERAERLRDEGFS